MKSNKVLLSFDLEEFDLPREKGKDISLKEGVKVSSEGLEKIINVLDKEGIRATFFTTGNFAKMRPELVLELKNKGHEIACHGVDHFEPAESDVRESKKIVEEVTGSKVKGYRQPRMFKINYDELQRYGYKYDSSVNPAFIPGRYNNFKTPRKVYKRKGIVELPVSAATSVRIPLFWLALHLFPKRLYLSLTRSVLEKQQYFATYFHPWEFADLKQYEVVPWYIMMNSGDKLALRLSWLINKLKQDGCEFLTYSEYLGV